MTAEVESGPIWMVIRGGTKINLLDPQPEAFKAELIARNLATINRFAGSYGPYSVAQHAVLVSRTIEALGGDAQQQFAGLHHDDAEAITNDIPKPVKAAISHFGDGLEELEALLNEALEARYLIDLGDPLVHLADYTVFQNEVFKLVPLEHRMLYGPIDKPRAMLPYELLEPWGASKAYAKYMDAHMKLDAECSKLWSEAASMGGKQ